jgi:hypothetical protein
MSDSQPLIDALTAFASQNGFFGKGPLSVALVVTEHAKKLGLPLDPTQLLTAGGKGSGGQVKGLGKSAVKKILERHDITRKFASEGGRTSRGSISNMTSYVEFLNLQQELGHADLDVAQRFWADRVLDFFASIPFELSLDASHGIRHVVRDVLAQARAREKEASGTNYAGAVMQHLVGAKLDCALGKGSFTHNNFSASDEQTGRSGDFRIGDVAIHVTTFPGEAVIERCRENLRASLRPILITLQRRVPVAEASAENAGIADRIDIFEIEQFIALNLYELGKFIAEGRQTAVTDLVSRYNEIIEEVESDPSLRIEFRN